MEYAGKRQFPLLILLYVLLALASCMLIVPSDARIRMRFHTAADAQELGCETVLEYEGGKCRSYHAVLLKTCECFQDFEYGRTRDIPERCRQFICDEDKPNCVSDPDEARSICTTCEHHVTGRGHPCVKEGSCYKVTNSSFCCNYGFRAERNTCVDVDECTLYSNICPQVCVNQFGAYSCSCKDGYTDVDGQCVKEDACAKLNCAHMCSQTAESASCNCRRGYQLVNGTQCTEEERSCPSGYGLDTVTKSCLVIGVEPQLIFVDNSNAYGMATHKNDSITTLGPVGSFVEALSYDTTKHRAYFVGSNLSIIDYSSKLPQARHTRLNYTARAVSFDWQGDALYVLDDQALTYWNVSNEDPHFETELLEHNGKIHDLVVEPLGSWLFWAGEGFVTKANLQGTQPLKIFSIYKHLENEAVHSERLAVDNTANYDAFLFYAVNTHLFSFDASGQRMTFHTSGLPGPVLSMDVFEDWVYMVIRDTDGIYARRKMEPTVVATHLSGQSVRALYMNHPLRQLRTFGWQCPQECEQLCFRSNNMLAICGCRKGYQLAQNRRSCQEIPSNKAAGVAGRRRNSEPDAESLPNGRLEYEDVAVMGPPIRGSHEPYRAEAPDRSSDSSGLIPVIVGFGLLILVAMCVGQGYLIYILVPHNNLGNNFRARFATQQDSISIMQLAENDRM